MAPAKILKKFYSVPGRNGKRHGSLELIGSSLKIIHTKNGKVKTYKINLDETEDVSAKIKKEVEKLFATNRYLLIVHSFIEKQTHKTLSADLEITETISSFLTRDRANKETVRMEKRIRIVTSTFEKNHNSFIALTKNNEVKIKNSATLSDCKKTCSSEEFATLLSLANKFKNKRLVFVSSTPQGGGVALMRHALIKLFGLLNADVRWYVLKPNADIFNITKKKIHNVLQAVAGPKAELKEKDIKLYNVWIKKGFNFFKKKFMAADVIVIDDPQPSGLIPYIKKNFPKIKVIYRSHIQIENALTQKPNTPQHKAWQFIWKSIKEADLFVAHPVASFVPKEVPEDKLVFMPASTDALSGLNKPLRKNRLDYYLNLFDKLLEAENQTPLDRKRPYLIQIARFDPSKGIPHALRSYLKLTHLLKKKHLQIPQLVITGDGSIDDPDRSPVFDSTIKTINSSAYAHLKNDIKVVRLPHLDELLNALLRKSKIVLQLSLKEGFEIKVTEALMKKKPVIAYRTGGIPLQIKDGVNGYLVNPGDTNRVAKRLFELLTDKIIYSRMSRAGEDYYDRSLLTIPNAIRWLKQCLRLLNESQSKSVSK